MEGFFLLLVALVLSALTGVFSKVPNGKIISGEIVSIERGRFQSPGTDTYSAWIEYEVNGKLYSIRSSSRSNYRVGEKLRVMYNTDNPEEAVLKPGAFTYFWLILLLLGSFYFITKTFLPL